MADNHGRSTRRWRRLTANLRAQHHPCYLCGQPIDYQAPAGHPDSFTADHLTAIANGGNTEDPANLAAAHHRCNASRGKRKPKPAIGTTSQPW